MDSVRLRRPDGGSTVGQRFEAKYILPEVHAMAVTEYIRPFVLTDVHAYRDAEYSISSVYLDNPALSLYWSSRLGEKDRFKLRIRYYDDIPGSPAFLEVKHRFDQIVRKSRAIVPKEIIPYVLQGGVITLDMLRGDARTLHAARQFQDLVMRIEACPVVEIRYRREAYQSGFGEPVRVTFDRAVQCRYESSGDPTGWRRTDGWVPIQAGGVIMEVKFNDAMPWWIHEAIQRFDLMRDSVAKYVLGMQTLSLQGIGSVVGTREHALQ